MLRTACLALLSLLILSGCGARDSAGPAGDQPLRVAVIPKGTSHQFWKSVHAGAERAAAELGGVEIVWKGPAKESDTAGQIEVVKSMITQHVDAIVLAPNHSQALVDVVTESEQAGIPVVIFDSGIGQGAPIVSYVATDNRVGGQLAAKRMAEALNEQGDVIVLRYRAGSESTEQREQGFLEEIKKYPQMNVLSADQYGGEDAASALEKSTQLLLRFREEVEGIFAVCEPNCIGTLEALEQTGLAGKVQFVAFDPAEVLIRGLRDDKVAGIVLQDPVEMGYQAVKVAVQRLRGQEDIKPYISTGEYMATPENVDTEEMQRLLNPPQHGE